MYERTSAPDVQGLNAITNTEDRLAIVVGLLEEEVVGIFAWEVGWGRGGVDVSAITGGVDVGRASGEADAIAGDGDAGDLSGAGREVDSNGFTAGAGDGVGITRPGALVVGGVGAGGDRNGYARLHLIRVNGNAVK